MRFFLNLLLLTPAYLLAQHHPVTVRGFVKDNKGHAVEMADVYSADGNAHVQTDLSGAYSITLKTHAKHLVLIAGRIGYIPDTLSFHISQHHKNQNFTLSVDPSTSLNDVEVIGKSALREVKESAYNVVAVDAKALHDFSLDMAQVLDRASGLRIRRSGGVGSDANIMLNGFSGRNVTIFIDGMPMRSFGSSFQINNLPVDLAERIEVYKGVVPITFGSDALGGAINIVTSDRARTYVDASYSYGSFNTHKTYVNAGYISDNGFTVQLNAFQNYSDNNYEVDARVLNLETQLFTDDVPAVRFHDAYHNETVIGKIGVVNKKFADRLLFGFTWGNEYDEIQNPVNMAFAYGQKVRMATTLAPSLLYRKTDLFVKDLDVSLSANYNFGSDVNIDTAMKRYNWLGEYIQRPSRGEYTYQYAETWNRNGSANANVTYSLGVRHTFSLNSVFTTFSRTSQDLAEPTNTDDIPSENIKNVLGLAYTFDLNENWNTTAFLKNYTQAVQTSVEDDFGNVTAHRDVTNHRGYGIASAYFITNNLQLKASYEKALRLPSGRELFGSTDLVEQGSADLKPENSSNINAGLNYNWRISKKHRLNSDVSFIYREVKDFIRQNLNQNRGTTAPINVGLVRNMGLDAELRYAYGNVLTAGVSFTYQNLRDKTELLANGNPNLAYDERIPNNPWLFGNGDITFYFNDVIKKGNRLSAGYNLLYVYEFPYATASVGNQATKAVVPEQISHDLFFTYSLKNGRYNLSAEIKNLLDSNLYDNFTLQKPGRNFSIKFRYYFSK